MIEIADPTPTLPDVLVTPAFVMKRWKICRGTVSNWEATGILKPKRIGRVIRYLLSDLIAAERAAGITHPAEDHYAAQ